MKNLIVNKRFYLFLKTFCLLIVIQLMAPELLLGQAASAEIFNSKSSKHPPRSQDGDSRTTFRPNTNIERISSGAGFRN